MVMGVDVEGASCRDGRVCVLVCSRFGRCVLCVGRASAPLPMSKIFIFCARRSVWLSLTETGRHDSR